MKILLVTRGSQGDIFPYIALASKLIERGHTVLLSLPQLFEKDAKASGIPYFLQETDDIAGMIESTRNTRDLLEWTKRVIVSQFKELPPLLQEYDVLVSSNTEFAAPSIAEYCRKPLIRTAYAPLIPGEKFPPPVMPWQKPNPFFPPAAQWKLLNVGLNLMVKKIINGTRKELGMAPIADQGEHAPRTAQNYLMFSKYLGDTDPDWQYQWAIGGYCFNDAIPYDEDEYNRITAFTKKDAKPVLFFTLGSCTSKNGGQLCEWIFNLCKVRGYKLIIGAGWGNLGEQIKNEADVLLLKTPIPHRLIFPSCKAIIHHGGSGTTHSAARAGKPQLIVPLILDQHYWGYRVSKLGVGPGTLPPNSKEKVLEEKVLDLITNDVYKTNAAALAEKMKTEDGVKSFCDYIQSVVSKN